MFGFAFLELLPFFKKLEFDENKLFFGGVISGFFGGLSGHQGALRSAFLIKCGLSKESFKNKKPVFHLVFFYIFFST